MAKKKFRGPEIVKEIEEAMDKGLGRFLINTQSKLSVSSPILTGRLASSWFIGKGVPDRSVAPEMEAGAAQQLRLTAARSRSTLIGTSQLLPYAARAAFDPVMWAVVVLALVTGSPRSRTTAQGREQGHGLLPEESQMTLANIRAHIETKVNAAFQALTPVCCGLRQHLRDAACVALRRLSDLLLRHHHPHGVRY